MKKPRQGFTIIEVIVVLGLTGLLLIGLFGGTFSSIAAQRYNDTVRSFAEYISSMYSAVINPSSSGQGNHSEAIYGKLIVFGSPSNDKTEQVYSVTLVGNASYHNAAAGTSFRDELGSAGANTHLRCDTIETYSTLWGADLENIKASFNNSPLRGAMIIARSPSSGTIHTIVYNPTSGGTNYDISSVEACNAINANANADTGLHGDIKHRFDHQDLGVCIKSDDAALMREVRIVKDGRNASAVSIMNIEADEEDELGEGTLKGKSLCQ